MDPEVLGGRKDAADFLLVRLPMVLDQRRTGTAHLTTPASYAAFKRPMLAAWLSFATIYPGWYQGRAIHIHLKVHAGGHVVHTGQLFFPEEITAPVAQLQPYVKHREVPRTTQEEDGIFESQHGAAGMLVLNRVEAKSDAGGFVDRNAGG